MEETRFGRYRLLSLIGEGGMGKVFKAHDTMIDRDVAIKILPTDLANEPGYRDRFRREAHIAARLSEPHVVPIYDTGEIDGQLYLVMPVIDGVDVASLLRRDGPMSPRLAVKVIEQLANALDAAHIAGLVHRDVKPSNALMTRREFVYLIDFGIAHDAFATKLTRTGSVIGTIAYMSPERFETGTADARTDIYALTCVLYECLTGSPPFPSGTLAQLMHAHIYHDPPMPSAQRPDLPAGFDEAVARGMAKSPDDRYQSALELAAAVQSALTQPLSVPEVEPRPLPTVESTVVDDAEPVPADDESQTPVDPADELPTQIAPTVPVHAEQPTPPTTTVTRRRSRRAKIALAAGAVVVTICAAGLIGYFATQPDRQSASQPSAGRATPANRQTVLPIKGFRLAVDGTGNVYTTSGATGRKQVLKLAVGSSAPTVLPFTDLDGGPGGVAVDAAGDVFVAEYVHNRVLKLAAGSSTPVELPFTGLAGPFGVAVDTAGNVYVASNLNGRILKLTAGSNTQVELPFPASHTQLPVSIAVDGAGNVYVTYGGASGITKLPAGSTTTTLLCARCPQLVHYVAVDAAGNAYGAGPANVFPATSNQVVRFPAGSETATILPFTGLDGPDPSNSDKLPSVDVAVDAAGNVYATSAAGVLKLSMG